MNDFSDSQLLGIARIQKQILWMLLVSVAVLVAGFFVPPVPWLAATFFAALLVMSIFSTVLIYRLAVALEVSAPWVYVVCAFIPYLSTATLLIVNLKATAALRRGGLRVGLMGAERLDLERLALAADSEREPADKDS